MFYSPLRYPGGKSKLTAFVLETMKINNLEGGSYIEPFAGGCAIAWYLLLNNHVKEVWINDLDPAIYSFWHSVLYKTKELCQLIESTEVCMDEWYKQRDIQRSGSNNLLELGFSTFFLNRTNRSGILTGGVIGGYQQNGNYKLDCRYNKSDLIKRIERIASRSDNVRLSNMDAVDFIDNELPKAEEKAFVNIDPPYYVRGKELYQNFYKKDDHYRLYESIKKIKQHWIVTYDNAPEIMEIYKEMTPSTFDLTYTAQAKRKAKEVMVLSGRTRQTGYRPDITFKELLSSK